LHRHPAILRLLLGSSRREFNASMKVGERNPQADRSRSIRSSSDVYVTSSHCPAGARRVTNAQTRRESIMRYSSTESKRAIDVELVDTIQLDRLG